MTGPGGCAAGGRILRPHERLLSTDVGLPLACGMLYAAAAIWLAIGQQAYARDALARTSSAVSTVLGRDPHLAAIGFIWNPLPSLVQVPLVPLLAGFGAVHLAGPLMSATFGAGAVWMLDRLYRTIGLTGPWRVALLLLYALNPLILFYAVIGLSEAPFIFVILAVVIAYIIWTHTRSLLALVACSLATGTAFLIRYEALAVASAGAGALLLILLARPGGRRELVEGVLLAYLAPFVYVVALWVFLNWMIMGDALYFQRSAYGNAAQSAFFQTEQTYLSGVIGSWEGALWYGLTRWVAAFPAGVLLVALALWRALRLRSLLLLGVLGFGAAIPAFHVALLYMGSSFGWLRFFLYGIPFSFVLAALLLPQLSGVRRTLIVLALALASPVTAAAMARPEVGLEEWGIMRRLQHPPFVFPSGHAVESFWAERQAAAYIDNLEPGAVVLLDTFLGFPVNVFSQHWERLATTSDRDFAELVRRPQGRVTHLLVPRPDCEPGTACLARNDQLIRTYPQLWAQGAPWAILEAEFGGHLAWRLYRVLPDEAAAAGFDEHFDSDVLAHR